MAQHEDSGWKGRTHADVPGWKSQHFRANALLRKMLEERRKKARNCPELVFGKPEMSGDNAVGVALIGAKRFINS